MKEKFQLYLIWVMLQRTVVTMISHFVPICISLVQVVNIRAVVVLIQNACGMKTHLHLSFLKTDQIC